MYNPFSFIPVFIKKWTDGTRFDFVKMICSTVLFISCVLVLQKWNTVPTFKDELYVTTYRGEHIQNDSFGASIQIVRPYYNYSTLDNNSAGYYIGITGSYKRDTTEFLNLNKENDSLISELRNNTIGLNKDSIPLLFHAKIRMNTTNLSASKNNTHTINVNEGEAVCYMKTYTDTESDTAWACGEVIAAFKQQKSDKKHADVEPIYLIPNMVQSRINININKFASWFRLEDISQCYYSLGIKCGNYNTRVNLIKIDFKGAVRFLQIYPTPDRMDYSSITYTDAEKISYIEFEGLKAYGQLLEATGLQSVRIYLLSAFATFFLGISLKILLEILWRFCKKKIHKHS